MAIDSSSTGRAAGPAPAGGAARQAERRDATSPPGEGGDAGERFDNPLRDARSSSRVPEPCALVIFGASGDLTRRKLFPALYSLARDRMLPRSFAVVGFARRELPGFAEDMRAGADEFARLRPVDATLWERFAEGISYVEGNFDDPAAYERLRGHLDEIDRARGTAGNRLFYLATPPSYYPVILEQLGRARLVDKTSERPFARVVVEKPFGHDLASARELNRVAHSVLREDQTFRIDHYLGKETVQNIFVLRFANGLFEPVWNARYVDNVQITVAESIGVEGRGGYFEEAGIVRDMVQNHLFQLLSLTAMEPPIAFDAGAIRDEKTKVLRALRPYSRDDVAARVVRGQYGPGSSMGEPRPGYREEKGVAAGSRVATFVAMKLAIDNWRWAGVPFYVRAGKALPKRVTEIAITLKSPPPIYADAWRNGEGHAAEGAASAGSSSSDARAGGSPRIPANVLAIRIQPDEGVSLSFLSKVPGVTMDVLPVAMEFRYGSSFCAEPPEAYERLLLDCMLGDPTLFTRADEVEASWSFIDRVLGAFGAADEDAGAPPLEPYPFGSWGPAAADAIVASDGHAWRRP